MAATDASNMEPTHGEGKALGKDIYHDNHSPNGQDSDRSPSNDEKKAEPVSSREDGKIELTEEDNYEHLGFTFSTFRKWQILTVRRY